MNFYFRVTIFSVSVNAAVYRTTELLLRGMEESKVIKLQDYHKTLCEYSDQALHATKRCVWIC